MKKKYAQFGHFEGYARQVAAKSRASKKESGRTARDVANENDRVIGFCSHVENPQKPNILFSKSNEFCSMNSVVDHCEKVASELKFQVEVKRKNGKEFSSEKSLRKDAKIVMMGVITLPAEMIEDWDKYKADAIKFLQKEFGENLALVIEHADEANPHLHYAVVPLAGQTMRQVDPFTKAKLEAYEQHKKEHPNADKKVANNLANDVYVEKITAFYDRLHEEVSSKYGLLRRDLKPDGTPVRRPRKERREYILEQKNALMDENAVLRAKLADLEAQVGSGSVKPESKPVEAPQKPVEAPQKPADTEDDLFKAIGTGIRSTGVLDRIKPSTPSTLKL